MRAKEQRGRGFSLIEALVALVLLCLGLLTAMGLQLAAKRNTAEALHRTVAAQLAYDILERMRGNSSPPALAAYVAGAQPHLGRGTRPVEPSPSCAAGCSPAELARHDLWSWEQALDGAAEVADGTAVGGLALPTACISGPAGASGIYTVSIAWRGGVELPDGEAAGCGRGTELYGAGDALRRSVTIAAFILARAG